MSIGGRFRQVRQHLGLSGARMGERMGVTKGMVSQWESDQTTVPTDRLVALAKEERISLDWLLLNKGTMFGQPATVAPDATPDCDRLVSEFLTMPPLERAKFKGALDYLEQTPAVAQSPPGTKKRPRSA